MLLNLPIEVHNSKLLQAYHGPLFIRWIPACAQILIEHRQEWTYLVPNSEGDSAALVQQFFACLAALMSMQLRSLVINSLADFVSFLYLYQVMLIELATQVALRISPLFYYQGNRFHAKVRTLFQVFVQCSCIIEVTLLMDHNVSYTST